MSGASDDALRKSNGREEEVLSLLRNCFATEQNPLKTLSDRFGNARSNPSPSVIDEED